jgi:hypothetical protein
MIDAMKDPRTAKFLKALARRLPGTTLVTRPMCDQPGSGEIMVEVLNAPTEPIDAVERVARPLIWKLWGDDPWPVYVHGVSPENTLKHYAEDLARAKRARSSRRRRTPLKRRRTAAR